MLTSLPPPFFLFVDYMSHLASVFLRYLAFFHGCLTIPRILASHSRDKYGVTVNRLRGIFYFSGISRFPSHYFLEGFKKRDKENGKRPRRSGGHLGGKGGGRGGGAGGTGRGRHHMRLTGNKRREKLRSRGQADYHAFYGRKDWL